MLNKTGKEIDLLSKYPKPKRDVFERGSSKTIEQQNLARQAITGQGLYDTTGAQRRDLQNLMGTSLGQASAGGSLGSARSQAAMNQALSDRSLQHLQRRQQETAAGIESLGQAGSTMQQYAQQRLDAPHTSAERYFGYLGSAPQTTEKTGGGGGGK